MPLKRLPEKDEIIIEIPVKTERSDQFLSHLNGHGESLNVVELLSPINGGVLHYIIACKPEEEKYISDLGFMTFITNPKFQKYYQ